MSATATRNGPGTRVIGSPRLSVLIPQLVVPVGRSVHFDVLVRELELERPRPVP